MNALMLIVIGAIVLYLGLVLTQLLTPNSIFVHSKILLLPKNVQKAIIVFGLQLLSFLTYVLIPIKTDVEVNKLQQRNRIDSLQSDTAKSNLPAHQPATEIDIAKADSGQVGQKESISKSHTSETETKKPGSQKIVLKRRCIRKARLS